MSPERDAFGDPIVEAGGASPAVEPAAVSPIPEVAARDNGVRRRRLRRRARRVVGLVYLAAVLAPLAFGGWLAFDALRDAAQRDGWFSSDGSSSTTTSRFSSTTSVTTRTSTPAPAPRGLSTRSLLRPGPFGRALAAARRASAGRLHLLRLAPDRADLQLARKGGGLTLVQLRFDGGRTVIKTPGNLGATKFIAYASIDRRAPQRLVTTAARRLGRRTTTSIDYVVLIDIRGAQTWTAHFRGGAAFQADAHGRGVRRIQ